MYADDTVLYVSEKKLEDMVTKMQTAIDLFIGWSSCNRLTLNQGKTKLMLFGSNRKTNKIVTGNINILAKGKRLTFVNTFKYLGVTLDTELNFNTHVNELIKSLNFKSYLLGRLKRFVDYKKSTEDLCHICFATHRLL